MQVTAFGAVLGLVIAIILIIKKNQPIYQLIVGASIGGLAGEAILPDTVSLMVNGAKGITPAVLRILTAGVLAGVLIESGAAGKIAETIIKKLGNIISPNLNTIAGAQNFHVELSSLMGANIIPVIFGLIATASTTAGCTFTRFSDRLKLIPYESAVRFVLAATSTIIYGIILYFRKTFLNFKKVI